MNELFLASNAFAAAGWFLLLLAPRWAWTERLVLSGLWPVVLALFYFVLVIIFLPQANGNFNSIAGVRTLFADDALLTAGWAHYLAFDLYVGAALLRQAHRERLSHAIMVPILLATFLLGPVGLMLFFVVKSLRQRQIAAVTA